MQFSQAEMPEGLSEFRD